MTTAKRAFLAATVAASVTLIAPAAAQTNGTPASPSTPLAEIQKQKELITAQKDLLEAQNELIKERFKLFDEGFGKKGTLTISDAERDVFHVTARSASVFKEAAKALADEVLRHAKKPDQNECTQRIVLLVAADRSAAVAYRSEELALKALLEKARPVAEKPEPEKTQTLSLLEIGSLLGQISQFTQIFRTDRDIAFTDSSLPDELLLDRVALEIGATCALRYPAGEEDRLLSTGHTSTYATDVSELLRLRIDLAKREDDAAKAVVAEIDAVLARLTAKDSGAALPYLSTVLRGELVDTYLKEAGAMTLSVTVASKGGTSMKTSGTFRSDRLFAAGGLIASYRLVRLGGDNAGVVAADVIVKESGFQEVPLK